MAIDKFLVEASHIMMFARSVGDDNPIYHDEVDQGKKWLLANLPFYSRWYRFLLFYPGSDQLLDSLFLMNFKYFLMSRKGSKWSASVCFNLIARLRSPSSSGGSAGNRRLLGACGSY